MNKKSLIFLSIISIILSILIIIAFKKNSEMIIQGEVETKTVDLSSKITGRVKNINIKKGDIVKVGDILVILDTPDILAKSEQSDAALELAQAKQLEVANGARIEKKQMSLNTLNQAQANLELAEKTYNRMKRLNSEGVIATQKLDEVSAQYKNAQKALESAKSEVQLNTTSRYEDKILAAANVKKARGVVKEVNSYLQENKIKAPISGQITDITVEEGELVGAGYPIITIVNTEDNWIVFNLREDLLAKIQIGSQFNVKVPAIGGKPIKVKVDYISSLGNYATWRATKVRGDFDLKTFEIHAHPVEKTDNLRAGMSAIVDWNKITKN